MTIGLAAGEGNSKLRGDTSAKMHADYMQTRILRFQFLGQCATPP